MTTTDQKQRTVLIDAHTHLDKYGDDEVEEVLAAIERHRILTLTVADDTCFTLQNVRKLGRSRRTVRVTCFRGGDISQAD